MKTMSIISVAALLLLFGAYPAGVAGQEHREDHSGPAMNFHRIDERLATGGHFVDDGLARLQAQGVQVVIDLRDEPPAKQKEALAKHGIKWINIPVIWKSPQAVDFERFSEAMAEHRGDHVLVQCQANYRASAMTYLYRVLVEEIPDKDAAEDLHAVWTPSGRWQEFMEGLLESE